MVSEQGLPRICLCFHPPNSQIFFFDFANFENPQKIAPNCFWFDLRFLCVLVGFDPWIHCYTCWSTSLCVPMAKFHWFPLRFEVFRAVFPPKSRIFEGQLSGSNRPSSRPKPAKKPDPFPTHPASRPAKTGHRAGLPKTAFSENFVCPYLLIPDSVFGVLWLVSKLRTRPMSPTRLIHHLPPPKSMGKHEPSTTKGEDRRRKV